jgi:hypothetical protein
MLVKTAACVVLFFALCLAVLAVPDGPLANNEFAEFDDEEQTTMVGRDRPPAAAEKTRNQKVGGFENYEDRDAKEMGTGKSPHEASEKEKGAERMKENKQKVQLSYL